MAAPAAAAAARAAGGRAAAGRAAGGKAAGGRTAAKTRKRAPARGRAEGTGTATQADDAALRQELAGRDRAYQHAYTLGLAGDAPDESWDQATRDAYDAGVAEAATERRAEAAGRARRVASVRGPDVVDDGAGFLLGLVVYALVLNYLRGGTPRVRGWIAAKFVNKPYRGRS